MGAVVDEFNEENLEIFLRKATLYDIIYLGGPENETDYYYVEIFYNSEKLHSEKFKELMEVKYAFRGEGGSWWEVDCLDYMERMGMSVPDFYNADKDEYDEGLNKFVTEYEKSNSLLKVFYCKT